ncbi:MAG: hypothetical protein JWO94_1664 [Verrucomicrobiaceae bacterium]|nr:hypothetical protein [Verrucomicrobiaceae bacterium]
MPSSPPMRFFSLVPLLIMVPGIAWTAEFKAADKGIAISAGSLGEFELSYPAFTDAGNQPVHKLVEARAAGQAATLKYEGGGTVTAMVDAQGEVTLSFANIPADVKSYSTEMLIDISFNKGGKWKMGEKEGLFPREKPAGPQLFSGNATQFVLTNAQGRSLTVKTPDYAFIQLTDNREWNWPIYNWKCFVGFNPDIKTAKFHLSADAGAGGKKLVDSLGQSTLETWPDKVRSMEDLKADADNEKAYYASFKTPERDKFGGLPGSGAKLGLKRTGFFHVEQTGGKSWLVDPEGNAFFHTGLCGFQPSDDYTYIRGREDIFEWLPKAGDEFGTAFRPGDQDSFSFYVANTIRKFGRPYDEDAFAARMIERVRKFGFNSIGSFSAVPPTAAKAASFPYVLTLDINEWQGIPRIPGAWEVFDPFDASVRGLIEAQLAKTLPERADDPLLIGYFIINEPRYDELPKVLPSLTGGQACKRELVSFLKSKYQAIDAFNSAWALAAKSFDDLAGVGLAVTTDAAKADVKTFTGRFLETMFELVTTNYRKHDKNHLLLGNRLQPVTINDEQLCRISGKYLDVMSYNYYTYGVDKEFLKKVHEWTGGKPMILSEFFWSSPADSGLTGGREVRSQQERGLIYRDYVEQAASLGFVVGIEWFTMIDQATTGRWFSKYNGESANTGLFSVTDRPWKPMVEEMAKTNHGIFEVLQGERPPFAWEHARERGGK